MQNHLCKTILAGIIAVSFLACKDKKDDPDPPKPSGTYSEGVMIINGGNFQANDGTISFLHRDSVRAVLNLYNVINGDTSFFSDGRIEGYTEAGENGLILFDSYINGEDKVVIVNGATFVEKSRIAKPHVENPRDAVAVNANKVYVSNWDVLNSDYTHKNGYIAVVDPSGTQAPKKIPVGPGPENMVFHQNKVYLGSTYGSGNNKLTIINTNTDQPEGSLDFTTNPNPIGIDANGKLWVSAGNTFYRINPASNTIEGTLQAGTNTRMSVKAATFDAGKNNLIFVMSYSDATTGWLEVGSTYRFSTTATTIDVTKPYSPRLFSALGADPVSKLIYAGVSPSYAQAGYVLRLKADGSKQDSVRVEISPEGFFFKQ